MMCNYQNDEINAKHTQDLTVSGRCVWLCFLPYFGVLVTLTFNLIFPRAAKPSTSHPIQFKLSSFNVLRWQKWLQNRFLTTFSLTVTLTFDLLTSKSNQFVFVPKSSKVVDVAKFLARVYKISCSETWHTDGRMDKTKILPAARC